MISSPRQPGDHFCPRAQPRTQNGQAMVFVIFMLGMVLMSLVFMYKAGQLTSEKMQLQNAADAGAYSVSLIEARDLNFLSYVNRAKVANEVAIAQFVGLLSWTKHLESVGYHIGKLANYFNAIPIVGNAIAAGLNVIAAPFKIAGPIIFNVLNIATKIAVKGIDILNTVYGVATTGFHVASVGLSMNSLIDLIRQNDPGAKLSDAGILSALLHIATYHGIFSQTRDGSFTLTHKPNKNPEASGKNNFGEYAALVSDGRDRFSKARSWGFELSTPRIDEGISFMGIEIIGFAFEFGFSFNRDGGSELRFKGSQPKGNKFSWSAADVTRMAYDLFFQIRSIVGSGSLTLDDNYAQFIYNFPIWFPAPDIKSPKLPVPTTLPFGTGGAQASNTMTTNKLSLRDMNPQQASPPYSLRPGPVPKPAYGNAADNASAWLGASGPFPFAIEKSVPRTAANLAVVRGYKGLPQYTDTNTTITNGKVVKPGEKEGFGAPYILVGVVKDEGDFADKVTPTGDLALTDKNADAELGVIAKAEVYFARPSVLSYFKRDDGATEYDNAFNPYWQARLVDTNKYDRIFMLLIQQKTPWVANLLSPIGAIGQSILDIFDIF